jgi:hypothetical protein
VKLNDGNPNVTCPHCAEGKRCNLKHEPEVIMNHLLKISEKSPSDTISEVLTKFDDVLMRGYLDNQRDWVWCPIGKCSGGAFIDCDSNYVNCFRCETKFCHKCANTFEAHNGKTCEVITAELKQDEKLEQMDGVQPCPCCKIPIQKKDGCLHMICKNCSWEFCWGCREAYYVST